MMNIRTISVAVLLLAAMTVSCGNSNRPKAQKADSSLPVQSGLPDQYTYKIINIYPHNRDAYSQGLFWADGHLWESSGQYGTSYISKVDLQTGKALIKHALDRQYFAEGAARLGDRVYLLTWREQKAFVYDATTLKPVKEFSYRGEGWGITTDGSKLYMSDGTDAIRIIDPETFATERVIPIKSGSNRLIFINELEWVEGEIWANVYTSDFIVRIDPATGKVKGVIDLSGLLAKEDIKADTDVLNGIAYDSENKRIFVTGKNWNKLFEIEVIPKSK